MLQTIPKWQVKFHFAGQDPITIFIHDNSISNVLRKVAEIDFGFDRPVVRVEVGQVSVRGEGLVSVSARHASS